MTSYSTLPQAGVGGFSDSLPKTHFHSLVKKENYEISKGVTTQSPESGLEQ